MVALDRTLLTNLDAREQKLKKDIPGSPEGQPQIHEKSWTVYGAIQK